MLSDFEMACRQYTSHFFESKWSDRLDILVHVPKIPKLADRHIEVIAYPAEFTIEISDGRLQSILDLVKTK